MAVCCYLQASSDDVIGSVTSRDLVHASYFRISESFPLHYNRVYRGFSRDVTRSRACLVTSLIRHVGGQASTAVCAVCALQRAVHTS